MNVLYTYYRKNSVRLPQSYSLRRSLGNNRDEQRKVIKYNHLVANCVIFYNVHAVSRLLRSLKEEGYQIEPEVLAALSPYITPHINRFGLYALDMSRQPPTLDYRLFPT